MMMDHERIISLRVKPRLNGCTFKLPDWIISSKVAPMAVFLVFRASKTSLNQDDEEEDRVWRKRGQGKKKGEAQPLTIRFKVPFLTYSSFLICSSICIRVHGQNLEIMAEK